MQHNAVISNEMQQRAKILSHNVQKVTRNKRLLEAEKAAKEKIEKEMKLCGELHQVHNHSLSKLFKNQPSQNLSDVPITIF